MSNKFFALTFIALGIILLVFSLYMANEGVYETTTILNGMTMKTGFKSGYGTGAAGIAVAGGCCMVASAILLASGNKKSS